MIEEVEPVTLADAVRIIESSQVDVALPQMFCMAGMTDYAGHRASGMLEVHGDEGAAERVVNFFRPAPG